MTITYDEALRERIRAHLAGHDRRAVTDPTKRHAAVAVVLVDSEVGEDRVDPAPVDDWIDGRPMARPASTAAWSTSPAAPLSSCAAGHLASRRMPRSGRCPAAAWTRAKPRSTPRCGSWTKRSASGCPTPTVLGLLDDYPTRSGYVITPVVIWGGGRLDPRPAPDEVVAVYRVGLHQLQRDDSPRFIAIPESPRPVVQIPLGNDLIHAPTGAVLLQLRWLCLEGRHDPVDELEQPVFAWK